MLESIFQAANAWALAGWIFLIAAPRWVWTRRLVRSGFWSLMLAALYTGLAVRFLGEADGGFGSLREVGLLFTSPPALLAGWVHYLAFDLFIGAWMVHDAETRKINHWLVAPCLVFTFLLGPLGFLLYFFLRIYFLRRQPSSGNP